MCVLTRFTDRTFRAGLSSKRELYAHFFFSRLSKFDCNQICTAECHLTVRWKTISMHHISELAQPPESRIPIHRP
jgi:hypothetical protein